MTNAELLAKIKAEIERRSNSTSDTTTGRELDELLSFLSTLESEKPINPDELKKEIEKTWLEYECYNEDYDKVAEMRWDEFKQVARHFAKWGAEHLANPNDEVVINGHKVEYDKDKDAVTMKPVPADLGEAADEYEKKHTYQRYDGGGLSPEYDATLAEAFIAGANWQAKHTPLPEDTVLFNKGVEEGKRLMMDEAVEGYVTLTLTGVRTVAATIKEEDNIGPGDKVRIIIVKEG